MFILETGFLIVSFLILYRYKEILSSIFLTIPLHTFIIALIISIPFILIEESINCIDWNDGEGCRITPWIIGILIGEIALLLFIIKKYQLKNIKIILFIFGIFGALWELLFGGLRPILGSLFLIFMFPYVMLSYAYIAVIPTQILIQKYKK